MHISQDTTHTVLSTRARTPHRCACFLVIGRSSVRRQCGCQTPTEVAFGAHESPKCPLQLPCYQIWTRIIRYENTTFTREASMMVSSVVLGPYLNRGHGHSNELELEVYDICVETAKNMR